MTVPASLYQQVMGDAFATLAPELQAFHSLTGHHHLSGRCTVTGSHTFPGKILSWIFGLPKSESNVVLRFELHADAQSETWQRHYPSRRMVSRMRVVHGVLVERLGPADLYFSLQAEDGKLRMLLRKIKVGILSCPHFLLPSVLAEEHATPGKLHFKVMATLPWFGLLVAYQGYLEIPMGERKS